MREVSLHAPYAIAPSVGGESFRNLYWVHNLYLNMDYERNDGIYCERLRWRDVITYRVNWIIYIWVSEFYTTLSFTLMICIHLQRTTLGWSYGRIQHNFNQFILILILQDSRPLERRIFLFVNILFQNFQKLVHWIHWMDRIFITTNISSIS